MEPTSRSPDSSLSRSHAHPRLEGAGAGDGGRPSYNVHRLLMVARALMIVGPIIAAGGVFVATGPHWQQGVFCFFQGIGFAFLGLGQTARIKLDTRNIAVGANLFHLVRKSRLGHQEHALVRRCATLLGLSMICMAAAAVFLIWQVAVEI